MGAYTLSFIGGYKPITLRVETLELQREHGEYARRRPRVTCAPFIKSAVFSTFVQISQEHSTMKFATRSLYYAITMCAVVYGKHLHTRPPPQ